MNKKIYSLVVLFLLLFSKVSFSNENTTYMVKDIPVYAKSDSAQKAKKIALEEGQRKSLKSLFQKGGIDQSYTKFIPDNIISEMIESIKVTDEIITKDSYSSNITILFNKTFINFNLKKLNIASGKITDNYFLYIPLLEDKNGDKNFLVPDSLWYNTAYTTFFENEDKYKNIVLIDNYDLANTGIFNKNKPIEYNTFKTLLNKYNSNTVIVATARYIERKDIIEIDFEEIDAENHTKKILNFSNNDGVEKDDLIIEASKKTLDFLNNESQDRIARSRKDGKNIENKVNYIDVFYIIKNLEDYNYILSLIENLDFITKYDTLQLTTKIANLRLHYNCDESELMPLFSNKGFNINTRYKKNFLEYQGF